MIIRVIKITLIHQISENCLEKDDIDTLSLGTNSIHSFYTYG